MKLDHVYVQGANSVVQSAEQCVVGPPGLEPGSAGYEPDALPLSYRPRRDYTIDDYRRPSLREANLMLPFQA